MTDRELMQQALDALELLARYENPATKVQVRKPRNGGSIVTIYPHKVATEAAAPLRERLAQPEQEFTPHEEGDDGWSDWVCPDPKSYLMKCCDCGLVHEAQFGVVRYKSESEREDCEPVDDPNLQAVFRMRRSEQWSPKDTAYRPGGLAQPEQELVIDCPRCGHCCPQSNILAAWMIQRGYATGHGDTVEDLLKELEWQIAEREREACAKLCEEEGLLWGQRYAAAIRARSS